MITYKRNIDGLPGVTIPGVKGDTGKRGAMTFYSTDGSTGYDLTYTYSLGFISDGSTYDISYDLNDNGNKSDILSIYNNEVKLELYDNILTSETAGTVQYQVTDIIEISHADIAAYLANDASASIDANKTAVLNYISSLPAGNIETIRIESVADEVLDRVVNDIMLIDVISNTLKESGRIFEAYVLTKLDTWEYNANVSGNFDYEVSFSIKEIEYDTWDGYYKKINDELKEYNFTALNGGSGFPDPSSDTQIQNITEYRDTEIKEKIESAEIEYRKNVTITTLDDFINMARSIIQALFDPGDIVDGNDPVKFYLKAVSTDNLYGAGTPVNNIDIYLYPMCFSPSNLFNTYSSFNPDTTHVADYIFPYSADKNPHKIGTTDESGSWDGVLTRDSGTFPICKIQNEIVRFIGYFFANATSGVTPAVCNTAWIPYSKYYKTTDGSACMDMITFLRSDLGPNNKLTVRDTAPTYLTCETSTNIRSNILAVQINVKSGVSSADAAAYKIEIEFIPKNNGIYIADMSSVIPDLWADELDYFRLHNVDAHGNIKNYTRFLNFDNESPGQFIYVIKEYNDANNGMNTFNKMLYVPAGLIDNYTAHLYIYSKSSASSASKTYLGTVTF